MKKPLSFFSYVRIDNIQLRVTILCLSIFAITLGLSYPLFSLRLENMGFSTTIIGINAALGGVGALIAAPYSIKIIMRLGFYYTFIYSFLACAISYLVSGFFSDISVFMIARLVLGIATTFIFVIGESMLNMLLDDKRRGKIQGIYAAILSAGFAVGPLLISILGSQTFYPFLVAFVIIITSMLPIIAYKKEFHTYKLHNETQANIWTFFKIQPAILIGIFCVAFYEQASMSLFPLYFLNLQFTESQSMNILMLMIISNVLFMPFFGILLDKISTRVLAIIVPTITIIVSGLLHFFVDHIFFYLIIMILGITSFSLYPLCFTEIGKKFTGNMLVSGTAGISFAWALGSLIGPSTSGFAVSILGINTIPFFISLVYMIYMICYIFQKQIPNRACKKS